MQVRAKMSFKGYDATRSQQPQREACQCVFTFILIKTLNKVILQIKHKKSSIFSSGELFLIYYLQKPLSLTFRKPPSGKGLF